MKPLRFSAGAAAVLLLAALYFFDTSGLFSAILPAVAAHEFGHALALRLCGARVTQLRFELSGLRMDYSGALSRSGELFSALAGPGAGLLFAVFASIFGNALGSDFLLCSAGMSVVLTAFNLLPAPLLDGGRALQLFLPRSFVSLMGYLCGCALMIGGIFCLLSGYGAALLPAGAWILLGLCNLDKRTGL